MSTKNVEKAKAIAVKLKSYINNSVEESSVDVDVVSFGKDNIAVRVRPGESNTSGCLYCCSDIVDFCRGNNLNFWIGADTFGGCPVPFVHIFWNSVS
ncbi:MAG: hypothetical protein ACI3ZD_11185 [Prevotella sp.]